MSGFLYFIPGATLPITMDALCKEHGLAHAFTDAPGVTPRPVTRGPLNNGPGVVVAVSGAQVDTRVGYYDDKQRWRKLPGSEVCVGVFRDDLPGPANLARPQQLPGHLVTMGDHRQWLAPIARGWNADMNNPGWFNALPRRSTLNDEGEWVRGDVVESYADLWTIAEAWNDEVRRQFSTADVPETDEPITIQFEFADVHSSALTALSANYRLGAAEADLLGLLSERSASDVLFALIDWPTRMEWTRHVTDRD